MRLGYPGCSVHGHVHDPFAALSHDNRCCLPNAIATPHVRTGVITAQSAGKTPKARQVDKRAGARSRLLARIERGKQREGSTFKRRQQQVLGTLLVRGSLLWIRRARI